MSYMTDQFKAGEVHIRGKVCGWYFVETTEFRPLMGDAMKELNDAGLVSLSHVDATATARDEHVSITLLAYAKSQDELWNNPANADAQREQLFGMRAAYGAGETVTNCLTGRTHQL